MYKLVEYQYYDHYYVEDKSEEPIAPRIYTFGKYSTKTKCDEEASSYADFLVERNDERGRPGWLKKVKNFKDNYHKEIFDVALIESDYNLVVYGYKIIKE